MVTLVRRSKTKQSVHPTVGSRIHHNLVKMPVTNPFFDRGSVVVEDRKNLEDGEIFVTKEVPRRIKIINSPKCWYFR